MGAAILEYTKADADRGGLQAEEGVGPIAPALRPPPPAPAVGAARDGMAVALRPTKQAVLRALRSSVYAGVGGSGSAGCRCPLGGIRGLAP